KNGVRRYLLALAHDIRVRLATLGLRHPSELVGRSDLLERKPYHALPALDEQVPGRASKVDLSEILLRPEGVRRGRPLPRLPVDVTGELNARLLADAGNGLAESSHAIANTDRAVGATLAGRIAAGTIKPPAGGFRVAFRGNAGQAFGFACVDGMSLILEGFANDSIAEAMSGGTIAVRAPLEIPAASRTGLSAVGNAAAYGATGGSLFVEGRAGQRCGVRNSGGTIVVEGAGKYAFEYMTGGVGVVLGPIGPVIASGMTGGVLFLVEEPQLEAKLHADARVAPMTAADRARLRELLEAHHAATGSARAAALLAEGDGALARFAKVVPVAAPVAALRVVEHDAATV
ncbi:MAG TPA: glutamate synthase subunit alpha, partial [bacterium]|nr:glutamate synthase subunit alpha [bacterium]